MFEFELLPNEMQLEILKRTEFRTVQSMKSVSKRVKKFIQVYKKYMMPIPIRQMFVTPDNVSFTLINSNEVCTLNAEHVDFFLNGAQIDLLWLEAIGSELEPISLVKKMIPSSSKVHCLKLGSSKMECDVEKLAELMEGVKCEELIVDWRFRIPEDFFEKFDIGKLTALTIGGQESRHFYNSLSGENFRKFHGNWLEIGPNRLNNQDLIAFFQSWKSGAIAFIVQYNIVISFPIAELFQILKTVTRQETSSRWSITRDLEELQITFFPSTNFSKRPSLVMSQFRRF